MAEVQTHTQAGETTQVFIEFVMQQAQNAALFLGQIPDPRRGQVEINLPLAKMFIDQLAVIRLRTRGNLHPDEQKVIDSAVRELQMAFIETVRMVKAQNIGAEVPENPLAMLGEEETPTSPTPAPATPPAPAPVAPPAPVEKAPEAPAAAAPEPPKPPEESRKRFTKSYGS